MYVYNPMGGEKTTKIVPGTQADPIHPIFLEFSSWGVRLGKECAAGEDGASKCMEILLDSPKALFPLSVPVTPYSHKSLLLSFLC